MTFHKKCDSNRRFDLATWREFLRFTGIRLNPEVRNKAFYSIYNFQNFINKKYQLFVYFDRMSESFIYICAIWFFNNKIIIICSIINKHFFIL